MTSERKRLQVTAALIFDKGKVLITSCRSGTQWEFPGGKLEPGETLQECLVREIREELQLEVFVVKPFLSVDYEDNESFLTLHTFICGLKSGQPSHPPGETYLWVMVEDLDQYDFLPADRIVVRALFPGNRFYSELTEEKK
ncbi:MAG: (deoxy)nucleoside triphosphate pyrophosphohydrolase [Deltaproteobacteria bacterium]|nr:(deoxy)nucleoside triphosphate pyrophosphohydrolase [Deltaproteobacteria bacterium]